MVDANNLTYGISLDTIRNNLSIESLYSDLGFNILHSNMKFTDLQSNAVREKVIESEDRLYLYDNVKLIDEEEYKNILATHISMQSEFKETIEDGLKKIIKIIAENSSIPIDLALYWENDEYIKNAINNHSELFFDNEPILIVGDQSLIKSYLYVQNYIIKEDRNKEYQDFLQNKLLGVNKIDSWMLQAGYRFKMYNYLYKLIQNNYFDNLMYTQPDEFSFKEYDVTLLKALSIPVFKNGVGNSNIEAININLDSIYFNFLMGAMEPNLGFINSPNSVPSEADSNKIIEQAKKNVFTVDEEVITKLVTLYSGDKHKRDEFIDSLTKVLKKNFNLERSTINNLTSQIATLIEQGKKSRYRYKLDEYSGDNAAVKITKLLNMLQDMSYQGSIRTLPYFKISKTAYCAKYPILLLIKESTIIGVQSKTINKFLSGWWNIIGFKHRISKEEAYSAFSIIKSPYTAPPMYMMASREVEEELK